MIYSIEEFLKECIKLQRDPYRYTFAQGVCNGHKVGPCRSSLAAVVIDNRITNLGVINEWYPNGSTVFVVDGQDMTATEFVRRLLMEEGR